MYALSTAWHLTPTIERSSIRHPYQCGCGTAAGLAHKLRVCALRLDLVYWFHLKYGSRYIGITRTQIITLSSILPNKSCNKWSHSKQMNTQNWGNHQSSLTTNQVCASLHIVYTRPQKNAEKLLGLNHLQHNMLCIDKLLHATCSVMSSVAGTGLAELEALQR